MPRKKKAEAVEQAAEVAEPAASAAEESKEEKLARLAEKARKLAGKIELKGADMAEKINREIREEEGKKEKEAEKPEKKKGVKLLTEKELRKVMTDTRETLVPLTDYIKCSTHLGTKVITPDMRKYVYKRRADGLAVINTGLIDDELRAAAEILKKYDAEDVFIVCKREAGWPAVEKFAEATGIRAFTKKYPAGIITNINLEDFFEAKLVVVCDPWVDKNALNDTVLVNLPVLGLCDTNNYTQGVTYRMVGNNKSRKSIGLILYILAREYLKAQGKTKEARALEMDDFTGKIEEESARTHERAPEVSGEKVTYGV